MTDMPETIQRMLQDDKTRRGWSYDKAGKALDTTAQTVQRWTKEGVVPDRERTSDLARFLDRTEQEIRAAVEESEREQRSARDLQEQVDAMRIAQRATNERIDELMKVFREILDRLPPA